MGFEDWGWSSSLIAGDFLIMFLIHIMRMNILKIIDIIFNRGSCTLSPPHLMCLFLSLFLICILYNRTKT